MFRNPLQAIFAVPLLRRIGFHARRIGGGMDRHFFTSLLIAVVVFVVVAALLVTLLEDDKRSFAGFGTAFYWAVTTVIGSGDASYVTSPGGYVIGWLLAFFGVAIVAAHHRRGRRLRHRLPPQGGPGHGRGGLPDHIVVCGWNATARDLIEELKGDEFTLEGRRSSTTASAARPATASTSCAATSRTPTTSSGPASARRQPAIVCPADRSNEADMRSILARDGDRVDRPAGAHRGRGEQPARTSSTSGARTPTRSW